MQRPAGVQQVCMCVYELRGAGQCSWAMGMQQECQACSWAASASSRWCQGVSCKGIHPHLGVPTHVGSKYPRCVSNNVKFTDCCLALLSP
jgi:hypothetical protein